MIKRLFFVSASRVFPTITLTGLFLSTFLFFVPLSSVHAAETSLALPSTRGAAVDTGIASNSSSSTPELIEGADSLTSLSTPASDSASLESNRESTGSSHGRESTPSSAPSSVSSAIGDSRSNAGPSASSRNDRGSGSRSVPQIRDISAASSSSVTTANSRSSNPTGDERVPSLWALLLSVSLLGFFGACLRLIR